MEIEILHLLEGAREARGVAVVIDVFRAFSMACYLTERNADKIIPVADIQLAYELKKKHPEYILIGERNERIPQGFDFGNSPHHILKKDFAGKTIVHTTSAGTQGLINASGADTRLTGSFVNAPAIVKYLKKLNPNRVSLVCMGYSMKHPTEEDTLCAEYIKCQLEGKPYDFMQAVENIRNTSAKRFFLDENQCFSPKEDFNLCLDLGKFDFVLQVVENKGNLNLKKIDL